MREVARGNAPNQEVGSPRRSTAIYNAVLSKSFVAYDYNITKIRMNKNYKVIK